jgi:hypothetical protein
MKKMVLVIASVLLASACSFGKDTSAAEQGVTAFHQQMDAGQYAAIYDSSASDMKTAISRDDFIKFLGGLHDKLGAFRSGKTTSWNDNAHTNGHYVALGREGRFEKGSGTEDFVFRMDGAKAVLAGYHVRSSLLAAGS